MRTRVLAIVTVSRVLRYRISLAPVAATQLRAIGDLTAIQRCHLTDPTLAGGIVAVAVSGSAVFAYSAPDEAGGAALKQEARTEVPGRVHHVDRAGRSYVSQGGSLAIYRDGKQLSEHPLRNIRRVVVSDDAAKVAAVLTNEIAALDAGGAVAWRLPVPNVFDAAW